jgi:hypothetical protein
MHVLVGLPVLKQLSLLLRVFRQAVDLSRSIATRNRVRETLSRQQEVQESNKQRTRGSCACCEETLGLGMLGIQSCGGSSGVDRDTFVRGEAKYTMSQVPLFRTARLN